MGLLRDILADLRAKARWIYGDDSHASTIKALVADGSAAMILYRLMQSSRRQRLLPLECLFNKLNSAVLHCVIGRGAEFGSEFVILHSDGIVINGAVRGGDRITIEHQVTIGAERKRSPSLASDIFIGAGAKVIGFVHVGDRARIGANAVVIHDVPSDHTAVGVPARLIDRLKSERVAA